MNKKITAEQFCEVFRQLWNEEKKINPDEILCLYKVYIGLPQDQRTPS